MPGDARRASEEPLPENQVTITERDGSRFILANGIPDHKPGRFPNRGNPNSISAQRHQFRVPMNPQVSDEVTPMDHMPFGVGLNGVPFDPGTAEFWTPNGRRMHDRSSGWNYDALSGQIELGLDDHNAHVQPNGAYHYHGLPTGLIDNRIKLKRDANGNPAMTMVGYAADGFPIYAICGYEDPSDAESKVKKLTSSYRLKRGKRPSGTDGPGDRYDGTFVQDWEYVKGVGDLDECNGRVGVTPEYPGGTYYYVITDTFPYIPRYFRGTPDESFQRRGPGPGNRGGERDGRRPPPR
jgi:YHYH protein